MKIALASPTVATSLDDGFFKIERLIAMASQEDAKIVCFPEAYLPGLRGQDFDVLPYTKADEDRVLTSTSEFANQYNIGIILGMERLVDEGRQIAAAVFGPVGQLLGIQTKNQIDPSEDQFYLPGKTRQLFELDGLKFGVAICHEGWRYPETVRWAAVRGAKIVFHPQHTGTHHEGVLLKEWGSTAAPYYERAMMMRSKENTIYFASVNYALPFQESATCLIDPEGDCQSFLPYGEEGLLVEEIDVDASTGILAMRYAPERYKETYKETEPADD